MDTNENTSIGFYPKKKLFLKLTGPHILLQIIIIGIFSKYFLDCKTPGKDQFGMEIGCIDNVVIESLKKVTNYTDFVGFFFVAIGAHISFVCVISIIIWRLYFNNKKINFFDFRIFWVNNFIFYLFYTQGLPIIFLMIPNTDENYIKFVNAEYYYGYFNLVVLVLVIFILYTFVSSCCDSRQHVRTEYEGGVQVNYYQEIEGHGGSSSAIGATFSLITFTLKVGYLILSIVGLYFTYLIIFYLNNTTVKVFAILEFTYNAFLFIYVFKVRKDLKNNSMENLKNDI